MDQLVIAPVTNIETATMPAIIADAGDGAQFAWAEFFSAQIRNSHTRAAYRHSVLSFLGWCSSQGLSLRQVMPWHVAEYFDNDARSIPTKKLHLAALRRFLDWQVVRHVLVLNPAASVKGERYAASEGKTPMLGINDARRLIDAIDLSTVVGLRDRAIVGVLIFTASRHSAVAGLTLASIEQDENQWTLRFNEKGGKSKAIPVRHDLELWLRTYMQAAGIVNEQSKSPLFRSAVRKQGVLTEKPISYKDIWAMTKRRLRGAGLPAQYSPHSFRVRAITDLLEGGVLPQDVQYLAGHADPRTTTLYDRRSRKVTQNIVERISF